MGLESLRKFTNFSRLGNKQGNLMARLARQIRVKTRRGAQNVRSVHSLRKPWIQDTLNFLAMRFPSSEDQIFLF